MIENAKIKNLTNNMVREKDVFIMIVDCDREDRDKDNLTELLNKWINYISESSSDQKFVLKILIGLKDKKFGRSLDLWHLLKKEGENNNIPTK